MKNLSSSPSNASSFRSLCVLALLFVLPAFTKSSEVSLNYKSSTGSKMELSGHANLNSWTMGYRNLNSEGSFMVKDGGLGEISALRFEIETSMLDGGNAAVDSVLYKVIANGGSQKISFKLTKQMVLPLMKMVHLVGDFTIGGVTRPISLQMAYSVDHNNNIRISGTNTILLSLFSTAETSNTLKALKCNNQLTFSLELNFQAGA